LGTASVTFDGAPSGEIPFMIEFACHSCLLPLEMPEEATGTKFPCPGCGQRLRVPPPPDVARSGPMPAVVVAPPPRTPEPPEHILPISYLDEWFRRDPVGLKQTLVGKRLTVILENLTWEVGQLQPNAAGIIELCTWGTRRGVRYITMMLNISTSKGRMVSRMQEYAERRRQGEIVHFAATGRLRIELYRGHEYLAMRMDLESQVDQMTVQTFPVQR
jgi:hypothetical protein